MPNSIVAEYQRQLWAMEPAALKAFIERLGGLPAEAQLPMISVGSKPRELIVAGGVARIPIKGVLLDTVPGWLRLWGINATGYDEIVEQVNAAGARADVEKIVLEVDSPGGLVAGVMKAASAIFNARSAKPVDAVVQNLSASGAYWLTSQANSIAAGDANTLAGSIEVYTYYVDWTKYEEDNGIKVIVIRSGEHKGMGLDKITDGQVAAVQEYIDATAANFIAAVAQGRGKEKEQIAELATGQLWIAQTAKRLGLVDSVVDGRRQTSKSTQSSKGDVTMDEKEIEQIKTAAAAEARKSAQQSAEQAERKRMSELAAEFPEDPEFAMKAFGEGWSLEKAKAEYCDVLKAKVAEQQKTNKASAASAGAEALATDDTDAGCEGDFMEEARKMAAEKKITVTAAMQKLRRAKPALHEAFKARCATEGRRMYSEAV